MILEIARIDVTPGSEAAFEAAVAQARAIFAAAPECHGMTLQRSVELPSRYRLFIEWTTVADHEAFRASPAFADWRALVGPFFAAPPSVEHHHKVL